MPAKLRSQINWMTSQSLTAHALLFAKMKSCLHLVRCIMLVVSIFSLLSVTISMILTPSQETEVYRQQINLPQAMQDHYYSAANGHTSTTMKGSRDTDSVSSHNVTSYSTLAPVNRTCKNRRCSSLISPVHRRRYKSCEALVFQHTRVEPANIPVRCVFRESQGHVPVALVSVPGSGNTWVRGLLEKATGVCTGSIYCDAPLRVKGFVGENIRDGSVLVVKTHTSDYQWRGAELEKRNLADALYGSAILLVRNPFDTFVSERNRIRSLAKMKSRRKQTLTGDLSHVNEVGKEEFGSNKHWENYVRAIGERWKKTIVKWFGSAHKLNYSILVVHYKDVQTDSLKQATRMLNFLSYDHSRAELAAKLADGFDDVKRKHIDQFEHYTESQKEVVRSVIMSTIEKLESMGVDYEELKLLEYLSEK